jgi:hypothetical protein
VRVFISCSGDLSKQLADAIRQWLPWTTKITAGPAGDTIASYFMTTGSQYYTTARFAMHAQCMPVCGNLFHHAVEMLLKGGLARKRPLGDLKENMGHRLKKLWREFKTDFPDPVGSKNWNGRDDGQLSTASIALPEGVRQIFGGDR